MTPQKLVAREPLCAETLHVTTACLAAVATVCTSSSLSHVSRVRKGLGWSVEHLLTKGRRDRRQRRQDGSANELRTGA